MGWADISTSTSIDCSDYSGDITILLGGRQGIVVWWGNLDSRIITKKASSAANDASTCTISNSKIVTTIHTLTTAPSSKYQHGSFVLKGHLAIPS